MRDVNGQKSRPAVRSAARLATYMAALCVAGAATANAAPIASSFTWTPAAVGLTGGQIVNANNFNLADFATITVDQSTGNFTEAGALSIKSGFTDVNNNPVATPGLNSTYSLYLSFNATGNQGGPIPGAGQTTTGGFSALNFTLFASPTSTPTFVASSTGVAITGNAGAFALATGALIPGPGNTVSLTNTGLGLSPTANIFTTFNPCTGAAGTSNGAGGVNGPTCTANESAFFTAPTGSIQLAVGNFSATTTVVTTSGNQIFINGGGGNVTQETAVPEPASLAVLGVGLFGLGLARRRARRAA